MNENLDLTKILEGCPKGIKLYSSIFGEVSLGSIITSNKYPIEIQAYNNFTTQSICIYYTKEGKYCCAYGGECTLFPSKDQRDWSKFERFWDKPKKERFDPKSFKPFDKVLGFYEVEGGCWECALFSHLTEKEHAAICAGIIYYKCIPYNEDTKHLVGTNEDCPDYYKWWEK